jgi:hypothetical protein
MRAWYRTAAAAAAMVMAATAAPAAARADQSEWVTPTCTTVGSDGTLSYTRTQGHEIAATDGATSQTEYESGLVALAEPNHLLAVDNRGRLSLSRDAGCGWVVFGTLGRYTRWPQLTAAPDGSAYVWSLDGDLFAVHGTQVEELPSVSGPAGLVDLAVDRADANHVRGVADDGRVLDSTDGGRSFQQVGTAAIPAGGLHMLYDAAIDPADLDHVVAGASELGAFVTTDGARTWTHASGLGKDTDRVNAFSVAISPVSDSTVYVQGLDLTEGDANGTDTARHIYASTDGGRHFHVAVTQHGEVTLANGTLLVPSASDPSVLYFVWGTSFAGIGTYLYRYDAQSGLVTWTRNEHDDIDSVAFNPRYPAVMYLGMAEERIF